MLLRTNTRSEELFSLKLFDLQKNKKGKKLINVQFIRRCKSGGEGTTFETTTVDATVDGEQNSKQHQQIV